MNPPATIKRPPLTDEERAAFYPASTRVNGKATVRVYERSEEA